MAKRLQMDDWPKDLVDHWNTNGTMRLDCIFRCQELDELTSDGSPVYMVHAKDDTHCGLDFVKWDGETLMFLADNVLDDGIYETFSHAAHHPNIDSVGITLVVESDDA